MEKEDNRNQKLITIGIPTYKRMNSLVKLLDQIVTSDILRHVNVLVIDDGGNDGTYDKIVHFSKDHPEVRILKNDTNRGYPLTLVRLFEECSTEYMLVMADDDMLVTENIENVQAFLADNKPAFLSPQFMRGNNIYRGIKSNRRITVKEFQKCSGHAPGLIYRIENIKGAIEVLTNRIHQKKADALVYPQVIIVILLLLKSDECYWYKLPIAMEGDAAPSGILDENGDQYFFVESRWRQLKAFDGFLLDHCDANKKECLAAKEMSKHIRNSMFRAIRNSISQERPDYIRYFDRDARLFYLKGLVRIFIPSFVLKMITNK